MKAFHQEGLSHGASFIKKYFERPESGRERQGEKRAMHTASRTTACAADAQPSVLLAAVKQRAGQRAPNLATRLARELARQLPAKLHFLSSFQIEHAKHGPRQRSKVVHSSLSTTFMESKSKPEPEQPQLRAESMKPCPI